MTTDASCLNCAAPLGGAYCASCGQRAVDPDVGTWHVLRDGLWEVADFDGRSIGTIRALASPGRLTTEFLRGRRAPFLGPIKLFLFAGTALTTTWLLTRGVDAHYYGLPPYGSSAGPYIDIAVRGSLTAAIAIAIVSWALDLGRRRFLDDAVFALHLVATLMLWAAAIVWIGTGWKMVWGTVGATPNWIPPLLFFLFMPAMAAGLVYIIAAVHRVYNQRWWVTGFRAALIAVIGAASVLVVITRGTQRG